MYRFSRTYLLSFLLSLLVFSLVLAGCGGGSSASKLGPVATVVLTPTNVSLEPSQTTGLIPQLKDAAGHPLFGPTVTFTSDTSTVTVANNGLVCAGTWDSLSAPVVCGAPFPPIPTVAHITATAGGVTSAAINVYVHLHITSITVTPNVAPPNCISQGQTQQYTATAFNGGTDITSTVGPMLFAVENTNVGTANSADQPTGQLGNQITVKAVNPGLTSVVATVGGTTSVGTNFTTCGPVKISLHVSGSTDTAFSIATGGTKQLVADMVDKNGVTITPPTTTPPTTFLLFETNSPAATITTSALVNGIAVGQATITASCTPNNCNPGVNTPIYSNPVVATVTGTAKPNVVYVTSSHFGDANCNTTPSSPCTPVVIPIPTDTNTPGTALPIPDVNSTKTVPNSILVSPGGSKVVMGSSNGLIVLDTATNGITVVSNTPGKVISISPNATRVIVDDETNVKTYVVDLSNSTADTLNFAGTTAAAWTPDFLKAYIVSGTTMYQYAPSVLSMRTIPLGTTGESIDVLPSGQFAYLATSGGVMGARATCRNDSTYAPEATVVTDTGLQFVKGVSLISGGTTAVPMMLDVGSTQIVADSPTLTAPAAGTDCPPTIATNPVAANWSGSGIASFTPRQLITLSNGTQAYVTSNRSVLLGYDVTANTTFTVPVSGVDQFTGGATLDGTKVYVGASDTSVHVIDTATKLQSATIPINFNTTATGATVCNNTTVCQPDLVVVQPK
jgi:hypothetical protein